jgi:hypothetical protein
MPYASRSGRAVTNAYAPRAFAVCDSCGEWYNRVNLLIQREWYGDNLADTGFRVCRRCLSKPQAQLKPVILPLDPVPILEPRPERLAAQQSINGPTRGAVWQNLNGFTQIVGPQGIKIRMPVLAEFDPTNPIENKNALWIGLFNARYPVPVLTDDFGNLLLDDFGNVLLQDGVTEISGMIALASVGQQIAAAATRNNILIYNPTGLMLSAAQDGPPTLGVSAASLIASLRTLNPTASDAEAGTVQIGTGEALMQDILSSPDPVIWQGSIWTLGLVAGAPYWAWVW